MPCTFSNKMHKRDQFDTTFTLKTYERIYVWTALFNFCKYLNAINVNLGKEL